MSAPDEQYLDADGGLVFIWHRPDGTSRMATLYADGVLHVSERPADPWASFGAPRVYRVEAVA